MTQQQVFSDRYELVRHVARGGMAQVYLARDILLDRPVALKVLFPELSVDPSFVERFRAEAKAAANLSHPNIVAVYDWGQGERTYFIVMEFVDGTTLSQQIRSAPLDAERAASVGAEVAAALSYAHRRGVIHRDVKPGNVLLDPAGQVKVADFGIARAVGAAEGLTQTGSVMGTATYFSPEQAQGLAVDARSDVYSLGVVLYEMVAGRPPFAGDNPVTIAYKHVQEEPPPLRSVAPAAPAAYQAVVRKAMAKDPAARYQTAADLRDDLRRFGAGEPVLAAGRSRASRATAAYAAEGTRRVPAADPAAAAEADSRRSRRSLVAGLAVLLAVLLVVLAVLLGRSLGWFGSSATIPRDIVGKPVAAAQAELGRHGLHHVATSGASSPTVPAGDVITSTPSPGSSVATSSTVTLQVSTGTATVAVPDVSGQPQAQATAALQAAGFTVTVGQAQNSDAVPSGSVIATNPPAGAQAGRGSAVQVVVSAGRKTVAVPGLAGQDSATASNKLGLLGFQVVTRNETSPRYPAGQVTRTDPPAGTAVAYGSTVTLYVSQGTAVPPVVGLSQAAAEQALATAGLQASTQDQPAAGPAQVGVVLSQQPAQGSDVAPGSTVTIVVGAAPAPTTTSTTTSTLPPPTSAPTTPPTT